MISGATNPATHPALLDALAEDFEANGYRIRRTLKLIAMSATYARTANALPNNKDDDRFYSHASRRRLSPEVLADAISDVLGAHEQYGDEPAGTRAIALIQSQNEVDVSGCFGPVRTRNVVRKFGNDERRRSASEATSL